MFFAMEPFLLLKAINFSNGIVGPDDPNLPSFPLRQSTSPASQMRIKELVIVTLVSSFSPAIASRNGKPPMVPAVRVDIL